MTRLLLKQVVESHGPWKLWAGTRQDGDRYSKVFHWQRGVVKSPEFEDVDPTAARARACVWADQRGIW